MPHANSLTAPHVTISIGVTTGQVAHPQTWEDYLKRADEALYMSKQNGRNRYTYLDFALGRAD
jgi:diguanylate cyclase (GGDEF)-like protein